MNDISERLHYFDLLEGGAEQTASDYSRLPFFSWIFQEVAKQRKLSTLDQPFVTSFTAEPDLLPLWLSYCSPGNGVAIGFRTKALQSAWVKGTGSSMPRLSSEKPILRRVEYLDDVRGKKDECKSATGDNAKRIEMLDRLVRGLHAEYSDVGLWGSELVVHPPSVERKEQAQEAIMQRVRDASVSVKRQGFRHESESRLIVSTMKSHYDLVCFRSAATTIVPYVPICLPFGEQLNFLLRNEPSVSDVQRHFISKVIVGPGSEMELTKLSLESLFDSLQISVKVETSIHPYREI